MADRFADIIATEIETISGAWTVVVQNSPAIRETGPAMPAVIVSPKGRDKVEYMAFEQVNVHSVYSVYLVQSIEGETDLEPSVDQFITGIITLFMPQPASMQIAGAWQTRITPKADVDRSLFGANYLVSSAEIAVDWINA